MPKDREKSINPAAAQRKADKQKALKKSKAAVAAQRTERFAHRNPERLQRQIDDLKALEADAGKLSARDKKVLEDLERDVARVRKAKEIVGDKRPPPHPNGDKGSRGGARGGRGGILGKRGRDWDRDRRSEGSDTDESVRNIPMPRDTPPPIPSYRARQREHAVQHGGGSGSNANAIPLGEGRGGGEREPHALPERPPEVKVQAQTVYEAKPAVRDLRKEAVSRFVPSVVQKKLNAKKGEVGGRLLEEEEVERLEKEGYGIVGSLDGGVELRPEEEVKPEVMATNAALDEEEERFERELRSVQMEEVRDEDL
ncbi:hypothetical protein MMC18_006014 [Xylographa bjoerkii]|nr:hypothetical protein [Xylographa bjoerkii]